MVLLSWKKDRVKSCLFFFSLLYSYDKYGKIKNVKDGADQRQVPKKVLPQMAPG